MKFISGLFYSIIVFLAGWLFNFVFDIQFALGVVAGWLMKEGYDNIAQMLIDLLN